MKKIIFFVVIAVAILIGGFFVLNSYTYTEEQADLTDSEFNTTNRYSCAEGKSFIAEFGDQVARVTLENGEVFTLENVVSASGARYANDGNQVVLSTKDYGGFVEENGTTTYKDCAYTPPVTKAGKILTIDTEKAAVDGPVLITIESQDGKRDVIAVPSFGLPICAGYKAGRITNVYALKIGDEIEVSGSVGEEGVIIPCESSSHYLRTK